MSKEVQLGKHLVGANQPIYVIAEIGINHNGSLELAKQLIDAAVQAGCNAVKFQKRSPELATPNHEKSRIRSTPWGEMTYLEYRYRVEFDVDQYREIDEYCSDHSIDWFASCWDSASVAHLKEFSVPCIKVASASITDHDLLRQIKSLGVPVILSTGMSTLSQIHDAASHLAGAQLMIAHSTSTYPCPPHELNLRMIHTLSKIYDVPIGYSGHETGLASSLAAAAMGARFIERHITLDRSMWGTDQAASLEPDGLRRLVRDIRVIEAALGDGVKRIYESEKPVMKKLRLHP